MRYIVYPGLVVLLLMISFVAPAESYTTDYKKWEVVEIDLKAEKDYDQPYLLIPANNGDGQVEVTFRGVDGKAEGESYTENCFWDGGNNWKVRFAPPHSGKWEYVSRSEDPGMDGEEGSFNIRIG